MIYQALWQEEWGCLGAHNIVQQILEEHPVFKKGKNNDPLTLIQTQTLINSSEAIRELFRVTLYTGTSVASVPRRLRMIRIFLSRLSMLEVARVPRLRRKLPFSSLTKEQLV